MYENNYNYISPAEVEKPKKKGGVKKTVAMLLAVAVVGGASGFGGAYLQNSISGGGAAAANTNASANVNADSSTISAPSSEKSGAPVNTLLSTPGNSQTLSTKEIIKKVSPSVVSIRSEFDNGAGTGTGIVFSNDGYIITNAHVIQTSQNEYVADDSSSGLPFDPYDFFFGGGSGFGGFGSGSYETITKNSENITVVLSDDENETEYKATIIGADTDSDLAVLKIDAEGLTAADFGSSEDLELGSDVVAIGYPMGLGLSCSQGIISGNDRELSVELSSGDSTSLTLIQTDAAINPGNSGGPLINDKGQVIGITSSKLTGTTVEGLGFAIPITDAMPLINDLMSQGYVTDRTPQFGITCTEITPALKRYYGLPVDSGVMVVSVESGTGAAEAGISEGDIIIAVDGKEVTSMDDISKAKKDKEIGDTITLTLARKDKNEDVEVVLSAKQESEKGDKE